MKAQLHAFIGEYLSFMYGSEAESAIAIDALENRGYFTLDKRTQNTIRVYARITAIQRIRRMANQKGD